jgi:hypothetical protein
MSLQWRGAGAWMMVLSCGFAACTATTRDFAGTAGGKGTGGSKTSSSATGGMGTGGQTTTGATDGGPDADAAGPDAAEGGAWTPAALDQQGELALWLEASAANLVISSGKVGVWNDLSQYKNNASNAQGGGTVDPAVVNGHDAVHFANGDVLSAADATSLEFGIDQVYIEVVLHSAGNVACLFSKSKSISGPAGSLYGGGLDFFLTYTSVDAGENIVFTTARVGTNATDTLDFGASPPGLDDNNFHLVSLRRTNSSTLVLGVDDLPLVMGTTGSFDVSQAAVPVKIGAFHWGNINFPVDLDIAELLILHSKTGVIADADVASVHTYLKGKYGL